MKSLENLTVNDYIAIFRRRIWYVVVTTILSSTAIVAFVWQLPKIYRSETTIAISRRFLPEDYIRSIDRQTANEQMDFVRQQLESRTFLEEIVLEFNLAESSDADGIEKAAAAVRGKKEITPITASAFKLGFTSPDPILAQAVTARLAERVIQLNESGRKEKVLVADQFVEQQVQQAAEELSTAENALLEFRNRRFPGVTAEVVTADNLRELQAQLTNVETQLTTARASRISLERRLRENEMLKMALKAPAPPRPATSPAAPQPMGPAPSPLTDQLTTRRAELAAASARYTALHPEVARLTYEVKQLELLVEKSQVVSAAQSTVANTDELNAVLPEFDASLDLVPAEIQLEMELVDRDIAVAERSRSVLSSRVSMYEAWLNPPPQVAQELGALTRNLDAAKQRHNFLSNQRLTSEMAAAVDSSENNELFRIIDPAYLPISPFSPNRRMLASIGMMASLLLGCGVAFLRDFLDPAFHDEEDVASELKLPILVSVPTVIADKKDEANRQTDFDDTPDAPGTFSLRRADTKIRNVIINPFSLAGENYRLLHTRLSVIQKERPLKTLLISSSTPHEGKTFSSCCIAATLAQEPGKTVLLIDGDLRRSTATLALGLDNKKLVNTFSSILRGKATFEESVLRCKDLPLHFLPSGTISNNPTEVLGSAQMELLLAKAAQEYDWVIVDSPPILAAADTNRMAAFCDGVLMVVHSGKTSSTVIKKAVQRLGRDRIRGVLMNRVKTVQSSYGYGSYYTASANRTVETR